MQPVPELARRISTMWDALSLLRQSPILQALSPMQLPFDPGATAQAAPLLRKSGRFYAVERQPIACMPPQTGFTG